MQWLQSAQKNTHAAEDMQNYRCKSARGITYTTVSKIYFGMASNLTGLVITKAWTMCAPIFSGKSLKATV